MGREGRSANPSQPGSQVVDEFSTETGDATKFMQQPVVAPGKASLGKAAGAADRRRSTAWGGFGVTESTHDNLRQ